MLRVRLIAAFAILVPILFLIWLDANRNGGFPGIWLAPLALIASQMACAETLSLVGRQQLPVNRGAAHIATFAVVACSLAPIFWTAYPADCLLGKPGWTLLGIGLGFGIAVARELVRYRVPGESISRMAHTMLVVMYAGALMGFVVQLRLLGSPMFGILAFVGTVTVAKLSDTGAYFAGRMFGRTKMYPVLSPKKTVEGTVGGILAGCLGAALMFYALAPWLLDEAAPDVSVVVCCLFGASVAIAGMAGDLFELLLKRDAEVKDSSRWLPGLGGVLDVLDSVLAAAPVSFVWFVSVIG